MTRLQELEDRRARVLARLRDLPDACGITRSLWTEELEDLDRDIVEATMLCASAFWSKAR